MVKDQKVLAIIILSFLVVIMAYFLFRNDPKPYDDTFLKIRLDSLKTENNRLIEDIIYRDNKITGFNTKIDSLEALKPKIITKYVYKYKEIDNASAAVLISEFDSIFAGNSIK